MTPAQHHHFSTFRREGTGRYRGAALYASIRGYLRSARDNSLYHFTSASLNSSTCYRSDNNANAVTAVIAVRTASFPLIPIECPNVVCTRTTIRGVRYIRWLGNKIRLGIIWIRESFIRWAIAVTKLVLRVRQFFARKHVTIFRERRQRYDRSINVIYRHAHIITSLP